MESWLSLHERNSLHSHMVQAEQLCSERQWRKIDRAALDGCLGDRDTLIKSKTNLDESCSLATGRQLLHLGREGGELHCWAGTK